MSARKDAGRRSLSRQMSWAEKQNASDNHIKGVNDMTNLKKNLFWILLALALGSAAMNADGNPTPPCNPHQPGCIPPR